jgi:ElaB/YqjD/DUF883 family membrane-anchored ribosome-binding protein
LAKKKTASKNPRSSATEQSSAAAPEKAAEVDDANVELENAASQVQSAREALAAAQEQYEHARVQAAEKIEELRETTVGELVDGALEFVKKNPGAGVFASGIAGFIIGRLSKR